jgi:hypothetical protein
VDRFGDPPLVGSSVPKNIASGVMLTFQCRL